MPENARRDLIRRLKVNYHSMRSYRGNGDLEPLICNLGATECSKKEATHVECLRPHLIG
jgi:hypothetical protein